VAIDGDNNIYYFKDNLDDNFANSINYIKIHINDDHHLGDINYVIDDFDSCIYYRFVIDYGSFSGSADSGKP